MNKKVLGAAIVGVVVFVVVVAIIVGSVFYDLKTKTVFNLIDHNWDLDTDFDEEFNPLYSVTIYVKIKNEGTDGSKVVWCQVTKEDLSTIKKSQSVFIEGGATKTIQFAFSNAELNGAIPKEYKCWVG